MPVRFPVRRLRSIRGLFLITSLFYLSYFLFDIFSLTSDLEFVGYTKVKIQAAHKAYDLTRDDTETSLRYYANHADFHSKQFSCSRLFKADSAEVYRARKYLLRNNYQFPEFPVNVFRKATRHCSLFKYVLGYSRSQRDEDFPLAFSILTYKNIEEIERLLRMVYVPQNIYCIHVDLKAPLEFHQAVMSMTQCFHNVFIASRLEDVTYAHFSRLNADLNCIKDLLRSKVQWKYLLNFASSEIPLKNNSEIVSFLKGLNGRNDIREVFKKRRMERFQYRYYELDGSLLKSSIPLPAPPHGLVVTKGLAYGAMSREFLKFSLTNQIARDFLLWSMETHSPDEHYWGTLNNLYHNHFLHSPGGFSGHPDRAPFKSRHIVWKNTRQVCRGRYRHNICVFGLGDLPYLKDITKLVANKFNLLHDPITYACMEEQLREKNVKQ